MTEAFLQYVWQHRLLEGGLTTTDGQPVVVERAGELNRDAGPDFLDARLMIGGLRWAGNVEVHIRASDWNQHQHSLDKNYNNVILHVVYVHDADVVLENGKCVPTLEIVNAIPDNVWNNYDALMRSAEKNEIPCASHLSSIPDIIFTAGQDRLLVERLQRKSDYVSRILKSTHGSWEQTCYQMTARYFGGRINAFPFELLSKITPLSVIAKIKDNPFRVESLLFGQAGLLAEELTDEYPSAMRREYAYMSAAYHLTPMAGHLWKFFRVRPASFPTIRISQFASLLSHSSNLFSKFLETTDIKTLRSFFDVQVSDYWLSHYSFDKPLSGKAKAVSVRGIGNDMVDILLINAWLPLLFQYGVEHGDDRRKEQALSLLRQIPAECNRVTRLWQAEGIEAQNAADTQALLQRYNEYCSKKRCLDCSLAFRLIKSSSLQGS